MPTIPDVDSILDGLKATASKIVKTDIANIRGFSERQLRMIAQHAKWLAEAEAKREFANDPKLRGWFLTNLEVMTRNFVLTLRGLMAITVEKLWNALVDALWKIIEAAAGLKLPRLI